MNLTLTRRTLAAASLLTALALAGCSNNDMSDMPGMGPGTAAPSASGSPASASAEFNDADVMFAQMMIPHHQQAVAMSDMILAKSGVDAKVTALAEQIKAAQQPEIDTMTGWLKSWGSSPMPSGMDHGGGGNGMMTPEEMQELDEANAAEGQKMFLEGMIKHHRGAITMAQTEIDTGTNPDAVALAKKIVADQQKEISTMNELLTTL